jgi:hypothetical protein
MTKFFEDDPLFTEHAKDIAYRTLDGEYDPLLACRDLADLKGRLLSVADEIMDTFVGVASEIDGLPVGVERGHWSAEVLRLKDNEAAEYREQVRKVVEETLQRLLISFGADRQMG